MRKIAVLPVFILIITLIAGCSGGLSSSDSTQKMTVGGQAMAPTLVNGAKVIVDKNAYVNSPPQKGDIILFKDEKGVTLIKRVIGLPGEKVEIKDKKVYVDEKEINEDYLYEQNSTEASGNTAWEIPDKSVFVLGDNRTQSKEQQGFRACFL